MANTIAGEETVHKLASLLLVFLGGMYIILFVMGKGGHSHSHNQPMEKMAVAGLILVPALSPCATTLPVFLAVGNSSSMMVLAIIVLLFRYSDFLYSCFSVLVFQRCKAFFCFHSHMWWIVFLVIKIRHSEPLVIFINNELRKDP